MEDFGKSIRRIWPKFFILMTAVATIGLLSMLVTGDGNNVHLGIAGFTALSAGFCYAIIPATNRATDEGNKKKFDILHKLSVWLTVAMLLANIAFLFVWGLHKKAKILTAVLLVALISISPVTAQDTELDKDSEAFNIAGYVILVIAGFGWMFFLGLLGFGIYLIIRKSRVLYEPKRPPVRCK